MKIVFDDEERELVRAILEQGYIFEIVVRELSEDEIVGYDGTEEVTEDAEEIQA